MANYGWSVSVGVEVMANSDNVVRGGLTNKHIAVEELVSGWMRGWLRLLTG